MDEMERELRQSLARRPAPSRLKRRVMEQRRQQQSQRTHQRLLLWQRMAATLVLACTLGGLLAWRHTQQQRKGEQLRQQVFTALRITNHALNQMNQQLTAHSRDDQE